MFNKKKPRLEPNFSFDLTRLSLFSYMIILFHIADEELKVTHPIGKIIIKWCKDDKGKKYLI